MLSQTTLMSSPFERENRRRRDERIPEDLATRRSYVNTFRFIITLVNPLIFIFIFRLLFRLIITPVQEYITGFTLRPNNPAKKKTSGNQPTIKSLHPISQHTNTYSSNNATVSVSSSTSFVPRPEVMARRNRLWSSGDPTGSVRTVVGVSVRSLVHGDDFVGL